MAESIFRDQDQYNCSICLDLMTDPVTIPCGHSYCMDCIKDYWDKDEVRRPNCPQCRQRFVPRPDLNKNTLLAEIMEKLRKNDLQASSNTPMFAKLGDIECDFCTEKKVKAVNSCLECRASYCEIHLQPHFDFPALKRHNLVKATNMPSCQKHDKLLEVFCRTDQNCICMHCLMDDHKGHDTVSSALERNEKQIKLQTDKIKFEEKRKEKEQELHDLQKAQKTYTDIAQQTVEDARKVFTATVDLMQKKFSEVIERIQAEKKAQVDRVNDLHEQLNLEITVLRGHEDDLEQLLQTRDDICFLQNFEKMPTFPGAADFPQHSLELAGSFEDVRKFVAEFKDKLEIFCQKEMENILERATSASPCHIKTGDRVRVKACVNTPKFNWGSHVTHKSIGVVKALQGKALVVSFPGHENWKGVLSEMELVTGPDESGASDQNYTINVGDRVRVKATVAMPKYKWGGVSHKSLGVIQVVDGEAIIVDFPEFSGWKGIVSEIEVVPSDAATESSTVNGCLHIGHKVQVKPAVVTPKYVWGGITHKSVGIIKGCISSSIQIGDRVQVKATVDTPKHGWGEISYKSVGVVTALKGEDVTVRFPEQRRWLGVLSEVELAPGAH